MTSEEAMIETVSDVIRREHRLLTVAEVAEMVGLTSVETAAALHVLETDGRAGRLGEFPVRWQHHGSWAEPDLYADRRLP